MLELSSADSPGVAQQKEAECEAAWYDTGILSGIFRRCPKFVFKEKRQNAIPFYLEELNAFSYT